MAKRRTGGEAERRVGGGGTPKGGAFSVRSATTKAIICANHFTSCLAGSSCPPAHSHRQCAESCSSNKGKKQKKKTKDMAQRVKQRTTTSAEQQFKWQRNCQLNKSNKSWKQTKNPKWKHTKPKTNAEGSFLLAFPNQPYHPQPSHSLPNRKKEKRSENQTIVNAKINRILSFSFLFSSLQHANIGSPPQGQQLP